MLFLFVLFGGFLWGLAQAPQDAIKLGLAMLWGLLALAAIASVGSALAARLFS